VERVPAENPTSPPPGAPLPPGPLLRWPSARTLARWALVGVAIYCVLWLLYSSGTAMLPFIIGLVLAYLLLPPVNRLSQHMPRWAAILLVYIVVIGLAIWAIAYVVPLAASQMARLFTQVIPNWYNAQLPVLMERFQLLLAEYRANTSPEIQATIDEGVSNALRTFRANLIGYLSSLSSWLLNQVISVFNTVTFLLGFAIVPFWLFYVLLDNRKAGNFVQQLVPQPIRADFWNVVALIDRNLMGYVRGQLLLGVIVGSVAGLGLLVLDLLGFEVDFILLLAIIAGITELIPIIGPLLGAIPAVIVGLTHSWQTGLAVALLYFAIQQLENQFLVPRVVGESLDVHPAVLMVALVIGSQVLGLLGIILSAPVTAIARDVFLYLYNRLKEPAAEGATSAPITIAVPDMRALSDPPSEGEASAPVASASIRQTKGS
jgi:predicted PurR-regulated permease PerM